MIWEDGSESDLLTGSGFNNQCSTAVRSVFAVFISLFWKKKNSELTWNTAYCTTVFVFKYPFPFV